MMRRLTLLAVSAVAAIAAGALFAGTASASSTDGHSTVGQLVCDNGPCVLLSSLTSPSVDLQDWGGFDSGGGANSTSGYHCNNVLYAGWPEAGGTRAGTTYYTVGDPTVNTSDSGSGTHYGEGDCTFNDGADKSSLDSSSVVVLRSALYLNHNATDLHGPACGSVGVNPCDGTSAGYVGLLSGNEIVDLDAGFRGDFNYPFG